MPAIVADSSDARAPPINAFIPNSESVFLWFGASEPIPPIWIPIDEKFANPHSMYVAIITDF